MGGSWVIPAWKLRRELGRLGQQLRAVPEAVWEPLVQRLHDRKLAKGFPVLDGDQPLGPKVALVLCWQPEGLAPSFHDKLQHLVDSGYAPFVVSNAPLSAADKHAIKPLIWRAVERPNFGYDFGGYRDGLILLREWAVHPDRLVILNDSVWFPLWPGDLTLQRAETSAFDVVGTILRQRDDRMFLESYFFSIRGAVLDHPGFRAFWDGLRLTSNKYKVIRRGERGFGLALREAGISMGPLFSSDQLSQLFQTADESDLRQYLARIATVDPGEMAEAVALSAAPSSPDWVQNARGFVARVLKHAQPYSAFPVAAAGRLSYPVLKKSADPVSVRWRASFLKAVDDGILPTPLPSVLAEARDRTKDAG